MIDDEYIGYYYSGEINYKCFYLDGKYHGEFITYFKTGEISYKCNYLYGKRQGEYIIYYESGKIRSKYYFIDDKVVTELEWISYNRNIKLELLGL